MRKPKRVPATKRLDELYRSHDRAQLAGALNSVSGNLGWSLFMAYIQLEEETHVQEALAWSRMSGRQQEAAAASGTADGMRQVREELLPKWVKFLQGDNGVVEAVREEEDEIAAER